MLRIDHRYPPSPLAIDLNKSSLVMLTAVPYGEAEREHVH